MKITSKSLFILLFLGLTVHAAASETNYQIANKIDGGAYHQDFGFKASKRGQLVDVTAYFRGAQGQDMGRAQATLLEGKETENAKISVKLNDGPSTIDGTVTLLSEVVYFTGTVHCPPAGDLHFNKTPILFIK